MEPTETGFRVLLDGRTLRTPHKALFEVPTAALAEAIAAEWAAQGETVRPGTMPLTRLANVAIDRTPEARADMADMIAGYGETDLLCHRAETPEGLIARQAQAWDPALAWAAETLGVRLTVVVGIIAAEQPPDTLARLKALALAMDDFALTGLAHGAGLTGSAVLALCLAQRAAPSGEALLSAAALDELWSLETWGEDAELRARVERLQGELAALEGWFLALEARG
jgi:chaperone required for assembly of F1-ATPase